MFTSAIVFALLSGVSAATWTFCLKLGSTRVNAALGAISVPIRCQKLADMPENIDSIMGREAPYPAGMLAPAQ